MRSGYGEERESMRSSRVGYSQETSIKSRQASSSNVAAYYELECQEALKQSLHATAEINALSSTVASQLNQQTEQLNRVNHDVDIVSHHLDTSQYLINGMKSWWGSVVQLFTNTPPEIPPASRKPEASSFIKTPSVIVDAAPQKLKGSDSLLEVASDQESEFDEGLQELSSMLSDLHSQAVNIGDVLKSHNQLLNHIQEKVVNNDHRIVMQKKKLESFLNK